MTAPITSKNVHTLLTFKNCYLLKPLFKNDIFFNKNIDEPYTSATKNYTTNCLNIATIELYLQKQILLRKKITEKN